ncbi:MAG: hypothetical protein BGN86_14470 [Caulobacterales bacterium 68-7]|nr:hypothetical protein [Caulobacterales bacterium]OJU09722.1 MAG: hypothetical protein BGN86_14470 [Caulobacterales bacterium 68-7]
MKRLRLLAVGALLCAPLIAQAQTVYGSADLNRNTAVVDINGAGPNGQSKTKAQGVTLINPATGLAYAASGSIPQAAIVNRIITKTNLSANTSTAICPTSASSLPGAGSQIVTTELFFTTTGVGVGLQGQTLSSATVGGAGSADIPITAANTLYTLPVAATNAITAYGAAGYVTCIQTFQ